MIVSLMLNWSGEHVHHEKSANGQSIFQCFSPRTHSHHALCRSRFGERESQYPSSPPNNSKRRDDRKRQCVPEITYTRKVDYAKESRFGKRLHNGDNSALEEYLSPANNQTDFAFRTKRATTFSDQTRHSPEWAVADVYKTSTFKTNIFISPNRLYSRRTGCTLSAAVLPCK